MSEGPRLEPGEREVFRTGMHPVALGGAAGFAAFTLLVAALLVVNNDLPTRTDAWIVVVGFCIAACGFIRPGLRVLRTRFVVTDRRVLVRWGALGQHDLAVELEPDVVFGERTRRWSDAGTVAVAAGDDVRTWTPVAQPEALVAAVRAQARRERRP
jgi:hypothetical protein